MTIFDISGNDRYTRTRRCGKCEHLNPAGYLSCQSCGAMLFGSEWVDAPRVPKVSAPKQTGGESSSTPMKPSYFEQRETGFMADQPPKSASTTATQTITQEMPVRDVSTFPAVTGEPPVVVEASAVAATQPTNETIPASPTLATASVSSLITPSDTATVDAAESTPKEIPPPMAEKISQAATIRETQETLYVVNFPRKFKEGTSVFESSMSLCIEVGKEATPITLRLPQKRALIFGRDDADANERPDIDLIQYGGYVNGISRRHAALELSGKRLCIRDLKSSNGTYLNDVLLDPFEPHQLRDGDQIRLGNMTMTIYFQRPQ